MTISDVTMNDTGPLCEALPAESISARAMSLLQIERICNHAQKPESYSVTTVLIGQHMPWNCFHATIIKQSPWVMDGDGLTPVPVVLSAVSLHPGRSSGSSHGHRRHRRSEVGIAGHNPTLLRPNAQRLHSGLQRFRLLLAEGKRGNPLFEVVETWKFIEVSLIHSTYSRQLDKSKHMQTARHKLLIWFKQNHYVVVARFFISTPYTWLFSQLSSKWRDQTYRVMV